MAALKNVKLLADLLEPGETVTPPGETDPGVVTRIDRFRKRLRLTLVVELDDGRTFEVGATRMVSTFPGAVTG